jgi:C4-dicarboxylate transporter DctM subunit
MAAATLFVLFFVLMLIGAPVAIALGGSVATAALLFSPLPLAMLGQKVFENLNSFILMSVPFFLLAAALMEAGGIVRHLINFANLLVGRMRGGLGMTAVLTSAFFAAICGSSSATVAAVGGLMIPALTEQGYPTNYAIGVVATAGALGILVPPSIALILYGFVTQNSIPKLFVAGILPGVLYCVLLMMMARYKARNLDIVVPPPMNMAERIETLRVAIPALCLPVFLMVGIYGFPAFTVGSWSFQGGAIFTPTEAAVMCSLAALLLGVFVYRRTTWRSLISTVVKVTPRIGMIFWIITNATLFGFFVADQGVPDALAHWLVSIAMPRWAFLMMVNFALIIAGLFLDGVPMILTLIPVLYPAAIAVGINPIHFAIVVVVNIELGLQHPPMGMNLFVVSSISDVPLPQVIRATLPWMSVTVVMLLIITYVPWISTFLPSLMAN